MEKADSRNIENWLRKIDEYNDTKEYGTTRVLFTPTELAAREYVKNEMRNLGLEVTEDNIGNIFGTLPGTDRESKPVWTGSHIDTVLNGGMFDGMAGVVGGMEALRLIHNAGLKHKRDISVIVYTSEEPTRFKLCCLGSRAMSGDLKLEDLDKIYDEQGKTLKEVLIELGYDLSKFCQIKREKGSVYAAVELHVEQSENLEKNNKTIGIVKTICAPTNFIVEVEGKQSHAGGTSMEDRRDAYAASCEIGLVLERLAKKSKSEYTTATVGMVNVLPNASNVIPGKVEFTIDIRDCDFDSKNHLIKELKREVKKIEEKRQVKIRMTEKNNDEPLQCDEKILNILEENCKRENYSYMKTISGAYHDSMFVGKFAPTAMLFVPSKDGISHSPEEWTDFADIAKGVDVLANTLLELANS